MANTAEIVGGRPRRRWRPAPGGPVLVTGAAGEPGSVSLTRNEVMREALGGRTWRGVLTNLAGRPYDDLMVQIRFHDRDGRPVGAPVTARADRLGPGARLHLQARLPASAAGLQVHSLRWLAGGEVVALGPLGRWTFGSGQN